MKENLKILMYCCVNKILNLLQKIDVSKIFKCERIVGQVMHIHKIGMFKDNAVICKQRVYSVLSVCLCICLGARERKRDGYQEFVQVVALSSELFGNYFDIGIKYHQHLATCNDSKFDKYNEQFQFNLLQNDVIVKNCLNISNLNR